MRYFEVITNALGLNMERSQVKIKKDYDKKSTVHTLEPGDLAVSCSR